MQGIDIGVLITKQSKLHAVVRRQIGRRLDDLTRRDTTCVLLLRECAALNIQCRASILPEELQSASQTRRLLHPGQPPKSNAHGYGVRWCRGPFRISSVSLRCLGVEPRGAVTPDRLSRL